MADENVTPVFSALTSSVRHLYSLLRCTGFEQRTQIQISADGIRLTVEDSRVMQAHAFIDKNLFNTYNFTHPQLGVHGDEELDPSTGEEDQTVTFGLSLTALLECLQIFGADASRDKWHSSGRGGGGGGYGSGTVGGNMNRSGQGAIFDQQVLRINGTCRFSYEGPGRPLFLTLEENGVITTCELATWESELLEDIPIARDQLALKIIMKASWLYDAVQELDGSSAEKLTIIASPQHPFFSLSATGPLGSTVVEFSNDKSLLETFQVPQHIHHTYKFWLVKYALKAMSIASKVSIRGDSLGTLSLQFMIEHEGVSPSFIDFRFLPFVPEESDED